MLGRLTSAMVCAQPDAPESPTRQQTVALLVGAVVAALIVTGFTVYGVLVPGGSTAWRKPGALIVEKETGSRFVLVDSRLRPVLNFTSARLLLGDRLAVTTVSRRSLAGVAHGPPIGIVGAPDALPDAGKLNVGAWRACQVPAAGDDSTGKPTTVVDIRVDWAARPLTDKEGLLVVDDDRTQYLVWHGRRFKVGAPWIANVLGFGHTSAVRVTGSWLGTVSAGPDLAAPNVPGLGEPGAPVGGRHTRIGQVFAVLQGSVVENYQLQRTGLVPLSATEAALAVGDPALAVAYPGFVPAPIKLPASALGSVAITAPATTPATTAATLLPATPPSLFALGAGKVVCLTYRPSAGKLVVEVGAAPTDPLPVRIGAGVSRVDRGADAVAVAPGIGALVAAVWPGRPLPTKVYLVTDLGVRYPLADPKVAQTLGYDPKSVVAVPPPFVGLLPVGPVLGRTEAVGS